MSKITRRRVLTMIAAASAAPHLARAATTNILVHKDPGCGCCSGWVEHLRGAGFGATVEETTDLEAVRTRLRVPPSLASCHTAEVAGYAIEGHVPAEAIARLLAQRPTALGLAVAGMPAGSPGMEGGTLRQYDVVVFSADGQRPFMRFIGARSVG